MSKKTYVSPRIKVVQLPEPIMVSIGSKDTTPEESEAKKNTHYNDDFEDSATPVAEDPWKTDPWD